MNIDTKDLLAIIGDKEIQIYMLKLEIQKLNEKLSLLEKQD